MSAYPFQEVKDLRKSGQIEDALTQGRQFMNQYPDDLYLKNEYAWVLYDKLKQIVLQLPSEEEGCDRIKKLFYEYDKLKLEKPNLQFSLMMAQLLKRQPLPDFTPKMIQWMGIDSFREDDFENHPSKESDKDYPSLVERLAAAMGKLIANDPTNYDHSILEFTLEFIDMTLAKAQVLDPIWLRYRMGKMLIHLERFEEAQQHIEFVVKKKPRDFWSWQALAQCHRIKSPQLALSIYVKSYRVAGEKKFAVKVLEQIWQLAMNLGEPILAQWAIKQYISIREMLGQRIHDSITSHTASEWYLKTVIPEKIEDLLSQHEKKVESIVFEDQWHDGNFLEIFDFKTGKKMLKFVYKSEASSESTIVPANRFSDSALFESGKPVRLLINREPHRVSILDIKARDGGERFDCLLSTHGVLDHHNVQKGFANIYISPTEYTLLYYSKFNEVSQWLLGSPVVLRLFPQKNKKKHIITYQAEIGSFMETEWITRKKGKLKVHEKGYGFVDNVYVPPNIVGDYSTGSSVIAVAKKKLKGKNDSKELGWSAISLLPISNDESANPMIEKNE
ncbi:MAG: hypothetical protein OXC67_06620 [Flavobacteriaceae bacterium]|nr:hypothetical protein [Flavobacteriaceae bacterium]